MTLIPNLTYSYLWFVFICLIGVILVIFLTWIWLYWLHSNRTVTNYANNFNISPDRQSPPVDLSSTPIINQRLSIPPLNNDVFNVLHDEHTISNAQQNILRLPQFWSNNAQGYFHLIDLLFAEANVTSERSKFAALATALNSDSKVMRMIADLWPKIDSDLPFTTIKTILLERFSPRTTDCLESFSAAQRGDDTVIEYLVRLQTLLTSHYSSDSDIARALIRRKLLDSVDAETCIVLYPYEQEPLESLAKHADRILARKKLITATSPKADPHVSQNPTNQAIINQMLESRLDKLDRTLSSCYHSPRQPVDNRRHESGHVFSRAPPPKTFAPPSLNLCSYHHRFGHREFKCKGPPCSMYTQHQAKKRPVDLHEIEAWRSQTAPSRPLLFIHDSCHDIDFLIDTGASYSIIPSHVIDNSKSFNTGTYHVSTIGGGTLEIDGKLKTQINLGFSQLFEYNFVIATLPYGIIGADFLRYFNLCVDLNARTFFKSHDEEKFVPPIDEGVATEFTVESSQTSDTSILEKLKSQYPQVFEQATRCRKIKHFVVAHVETNTEVPVWSRSRRLAPDKFEALKREIERLVTQGILAESHGPWPSPIVMVKKPSGEYRLYADFVALNKILKVPRYAIPSINNFSAMAHGCSWFSSIDIKDAYYHIPVRPADPHKLTITTPIANFKYLFLPMGLATSSSYFQKLMNEVLSGLPQVFVYLDDIIIMSSSLEDHQRLLHLVFKRLEEHGLVVNTKKCVLAVNQLSFLGHIVSSEGVKPTTTNMQAIVDYEKPRTKKQLRRFLGMIQFYNRFIPNCAKILGPLYSLTSTENRASRISWTPETDKCFARAKTAITEATILAHPDHEADLELNSRRQ